MSTDIMNKAKTSFNALHIESQYPIPKKIGIIQNFLGEHYFHKNGFMYSNWFWKDDELRPFEEEDFEKYNIPAHRDNYTKSGFWCGENSPMVSGTFLYSQSLRYQITGEPQALEYARKAFGSLKLIFALTEATGERGFIGKPYDWKATDETSPDQYICVMHGLWEYRKIADISSRHHIDRLLVEMANWWRKKDYTLTYFHVVWPILPHHAPAMACLQSMAYKVSGDQTHFNECCRLLNLAEGWPTWIDRNRRELAIPTGWPPEKKGVRWPDKVHGLEYDPSRRDYLLFCAEVGELWLTTICADYFMKQESSFAPLIKNAIGRHYKYMQFGLREDLLTLYNIQVDLDRDIWKSVTKKGMPFKLGVFQFTNEMCWQDFAGRLPDVCIIGHQHAPEFCPGALGLAKRMLKALDDRRMHWFVDPDGKQSNDPNEGKIHVLSSDVPVFTLLSYWRAKYHGINLE
ncbi:MAG: hypothetical protein A2Y12_04800 [Planctomycetes bacterium GWF2_42_9]|nr:MAG: hypothetical protein A2Y12_04800 [Planctomycetes bacterium GWF2_42_9]